MSELINQFSNKNINKAGITSTLQMMWSSKGNVHFIR